MAEGPTSDWGRNQAGTLTAIGASPSINVYAAQNLADAAATLNAYSVSGSFALEETA